MKILFDLITFFCLFFLLLGCTGNSDKNKPADPILTEEITIPFKNPSITDVNVYMENSASMKGYNTKDCNGFTSVISELVSIYGRNNTKGYFYSNKLSDSSDAKSFANMIASKEIQYGNSSPINIICDSILSKNKSLSFLITDGIISGTDEQIRHNRLYNKNYREELQNDLSDILRGKDNLAVSIYKFQSNFNGTYYCYDNTKVLLEDISRPFYIIAMGENECVNDFKTKVEKGSLEYFKPIEQLHLGLIKLPYEAKFSAGEQTVQPIDHEHIIQVDPAKIRKHGKRENKYFLDLSAYLPGLPDYIGTNKYMQENASIYYNDERITNADNIVFNEDSQTLHIYIDLNNIGKKESILRCIIKYELPDWYIRDSSKDDKDIATDIVQKTFNLEYLIKGFRNGITDRSIDLLNSEYKIKR